MLALYTCRDRRPGGLYAFSPSCFTLCGALICIVKAVHAETLAAGLAKRAGTKIAAAKRTTPNGRPASSSLGAEGLNLTSYNEPMLAGAHRCAYVTAS